MSLTKTQLFIQQRLREQFHEKSEIHFNTVGGGCINETYRISIGEHQFFCKLNSATEFPQLFEKERNGLELIARQNVIKTPKAVDCFETHGMQILLLEWIVTGERTENFWEKFGEQLAHLHHVSNEYFGLNEDNYMGSVPQLNQQTKNWIEFFIHLRLEPLIDKCLQQKLLKTKHQSQFESLYKKLSNIFNTKEKPSLLHGDLWSGNFMCNENSEPVLIDTAAYFGHHSVDLGMTTLFGGFHPVFYEAYNYHSPFPENYKEQWEVCNLYPLLIHLILFGRSYLSQIEQTLNHYC